MTKEDFEYLIKGKSDEQLSQICVSFLAHASNEDRRKWEIIQNRREGLDWMDDYFREGKKRNDLPGNVPIFGGKSEIRDLEFLDGNRVYE